MIDNRYMDKIDVPFLFSALGLILIGLVALYSSSQPVIQGAAGTNYFVLQSIWVSMGLVAMVVAAAFPLRILNNIAYGLFLVALALLLAVLVAGVAGYGAVRWIRIGPLNFQPSEFAKLASILAAAKFLGEGHRDVNRPLDFALASLFFVLPFLLIARQPDLGTALVFGALVLPVFFWAGLKPGNLFLIIMPALTMVASFNFIAFFAVMALLSLYLIITRRPLWMKIFNFVLNVFIGLIMPVLWGHLKDYQKKRILTFLNPEADPLGAGYQVIQSMVAIGSGGLRGKGFLQGSQTQLRFLPEQHTDFIIAVIGEEFGFIGILVVLVLFTILLIRMIRIASLTKSRVNSILVIGMATVIAFHFLVNMGMTVGLMPVTGLPLPFISYGGSALLTNMVFVGLTLNVYRNRFEYF